jgi:hypothetical protein
MTYAEHQEQQRRTLDARRALDRAEMTSAQAARLARRISAEHDARTAAAARQNVAPWASLDWIDRTVADLAALTTTTQEQNR